MQVPGIARILARAVKRRRTVSTGSEDDVEENGPERPLADTRRRAAEELARLVEMMARLRGPGGCPWDREQDHRSLRPYLVEEAYEVLDALEAGSSRALCEELGDLLFQVVFHAELSRETGAWDLGDVVRGIADKIEYRLETPMIIAKIDGTTMALVVDEVEDVLGLPFGCVQDAPAMHALSEKLMGVARLDDGLVYVIDAARLLDGVGAVA
jgi:NTP pyrophosphatase (non-canonical NTP hydrolase)